MYNGILLSHKKEWNNGIWRNMDGPRNYHISQTVRDKYHMLSVICGILTKGTNELICWTEIDSQTKKLMVVKGDRWGGGRSGLGVWNGNVLKLGCDDGSIRINIVKFIKLKN